MPTGEGPGWRTHNLMLFANVHKPTWPYWKNDGFGAGLSPPGGRRPRGCAESEPSGHGGLRPAHEQPWPQPNVGTNSPTTGRSDRGR